MKKLVRAAITIILSLILALLSAALTSTTPVFPLPELSGATLQQTTPTPQSQGKSEIGSTDGIVLMGGIIVLIIFAPILINRKTWR
jgi:hypothetical protein